MDGMVVRGLDRHSGRDDRYFGDSAFRVTIAPLVTVVPMMAVSLLSNAVGSSCSTAEVADGAVAGVDRIGAPFVSAVKLLLW